MDRLDTDTDMEVFHWQGYGKAASVNICVAIWRNNSILFNDFALMIGARNDSVHKC